MACRRGWNEEWVLMICTWYEEWVLMTCGVVPGGVGGGAAGVALGPRRHVGPVMGPGAGRGHRHHGRDVRARVVVVVAAGAARAVACVGREAEAAEALAEGDGGVGGGGAFVAVGQLRAALGQQCLGQLPFHVGREVLGEGLETCMTRKMRGERHASDVRLRGRRDSCAG